MKIGGDSAPTMVTHARSGGRPDHRARVAVGAGTGHSRGAGLPGMEIRQGTNVCTLGYVDPQMRIAFTAGHCRGNGQVSDRDGNLIGTQALFRDNTPDGATVDTNHQIADWEAISLAPDVMVNNILPGGRQLVADPGDRARGRPAGVPLRCDHGGELRNHPGRQQRLVHDGQRRGEPEGRLGRAGLQPHPRWQGGDRRNVQQHLGSVPGGGVVAGASQQAREDVVSATSGSVSTPSPSP